MQEIYEIKKAVVDRMKRNVTENGSGRMDLEEMDVLADVLKDLAEADYYCGVAEAMEASGYSPMGPGYDMAYYGYDGSGRGGMGYNGGGGQGGGGRSGYRDSMGRFASRGGRRGYGGMGYDMEAMQELRDAMGTATPEDREKMQRELRQIMGM